MRKTKKSPVFKRGKRVICTAALLLAFSANAQAASYTVQKGDTYWLIAEKYSVDFYDLLEANGADESMWLEVGDVITIPSVNSYTVQKGDTYWTVAKKLNVDFYDLLNANGADESSWLEVGDVITVPSDNSYTVQKGDTYWTVAKKLNVDFYDLLEANGADESSWLEVGDIIAVPSGTVTGTASESGKPYITYTTYTVKSGDTYWSIANSVGLPMDELLSANSLTESSPIYVGKVLTVPVHNVPVKSTPGSQYGEYLDWWEEAQYVIPVGAVFTVQDFYTGKTFTAKRTTGSGHADCEPLTASDTAKMNEIFGGQNWTSRPVLIIYNGRKIAASATSMLHAGNDSAAGGTWVSWRSDNYGEGYNYDWVKGNNADGVFDIHFANSVRHSDGKTNAKHQANVKIAAGV
jgi:LysM repeat protein